jgi:hypothetical protein
MVRVVVAAVLKNVCVWEVAEVLRESFECVQMGCVRKQARNNKMLSQPNEL